MNFFKNKIKYGFLIPLFSLLLVPNIANAQLSFIGDIGASVIQKMVEVFVFLFQYVAGLLVTLGGKLVNFALDFNVNYLTGPDQAEVISIGWQIARDIANLGFVLAIIIIAIATIVRWKEYGAKKLLPKLIGAAIIVNFSLAIAGGFLGFANTITDFFLTTQMQGVEAVGENITAAFGPQKFFTEDLSGTENAPPPQDGSGFTGAAINSIMGSFFSVIFTLIAFLVLIALAIMLMIRFVYIALLLIVSPIVWLFWVIPQLENIFRDWWKQFLRWTFFAPAVSFFIYIALVSVEQLANSGPAQLVGSGFTGGLENIMIQGSQMIIIAGLMIGGLLMADAIGIKGSKAGLLIAEAGLDRTKSFVSTRAKRGRDRALTAGINEEGETGLERLSKNKTLQQIPGIRGALTGIAGSSNRAKERLKDQSKTADDKYKGRTRSDLVNTTNRQWRTATPDKAASLGIQSAKKGGWADLSEAAQNKVIDAARKTGRESELMSVAPTTAKAFGKSTEEAMSKLEDVTKLDPGTIKQDDVALNTTFPQVDKLGKEGDSKQKDALLEAIISQNGIEKDMYNEIKEMKKEIDKKKNQAIDAGRRGDSAEAKRLQSERDAMKDNLKNKQKSLSENQKKAFKKLEHMEKKEYWEDSINKKIK